MMMTAALNSSFRRSIRSRIWAWTVTSSAVVGSSAISRSGFSASAMAIMARCRMPPGVLVRVLASPAPSGLGMLDPAEHVDGLLEGLLLGHVLWVRIASTIWSPTR